MAQETKHTPGPWTVDMKYIGKMWTDSISVADADGGHVAHLTRGYEGDENGDGCPSFANARLIAAAPDLLDALIDLLPAAGFDNMDITSLEREKSLGNGSARLIINARAAIAKATKL